MFLCDLFVLPCFAYDVKFVSPSYACDMKFVSPWYEPRDIQGFMNRSLSLSLWLSFSLCISFGMPWERACLRMHTVVVFGESRARSMRRSYIWPCVRQCTGNARCNFLSLEPINLPSALPHLPFCFVKPLNAVHCVILTHISCHYQQGIHFPSLFGWSSRSLCRPKPVIQYCFGLI